MEDRAVVSPGTIGVARMTSITTENKQTRGTEEPAGFSASHLMFFDLLFCSLC